jgi:hypothetical protein
VHIPDLKRGVKRSTSLAIRNKMIVLLLHQIVPKALWKETLYEKRTRHRTVNISAYTVRVRFIPRPPPTLPTYYSSIESKLPTPPRPSPGDTHIFQNTRIAGYWGRGCVYVCVYSKASINLHETTYFILFPASC